MSSQRDEAEAVIDGLRGLQVGDRVRVRRLASTPMPDWIGVIISGPALDMFVVRFLLAPLGALTAPPPPLSYYADELESTRLSDE